MALAELPPFTVVFGRVFLAAIALNMIVAATGNRMPRSARTWAAFFVMGLLNNLIPFCLIFWGQTRIASGLASILNSTTPLFAVVPAHLLTKDEKLTLNRLAGVLLGIGGVAAMIGKPSAVPAVARACAANKLAVVVSLPPDRSHGRRPQRLGNKA